MSCPICKNAQAEQSGDFFTQDAYGWDCPQCGVYRISRLAVVLLERGFDNTNRWRVSAWLRQTNPTMLTTKGLEEACSAKVPSLSVRADRLLRWIAAKYPPGHSFTLDGLISENFTRGAILGVELIAIGWNRTRSELEYMLREVLINQLNHLVKASTAASSNMFQISPLGLLHLEGTSGSDSPIGFCAMWFNEEVAPLWTDVIEPAIRNAGYEPLRIDNKEHLGKIDDEIVASIRSAKFVVADYTGHRGGIYYEAGFAHGLGIPVVFMCRADEMTELHFDIRQYNCIVWTAQEMAEAQTQLTNRIRATLGQGPLKIPE